MLAAREFRRCFDKAGAAFSFAAMAARDFITSASTMEQDEPRQEGEVPQAAAKLAASAEPRANAPRDGPDWEAIKHAVLHSGLSYRRIAEKYGASEKTIANKAREEGWVRIVPLQRLPSGRKPRPPGAPAPKRPTADQIRRRRMIARLFAVLDAKLKEIEERMANRACEGGSPASAADTERDVRAFGQLMRIYAKLAALDDAERDKTGDKEDNADLRTIEDADSLRREIARRIERLSGAGEA